MSNRPLSALVRHIYRRAGAETPDTGDHALLTAFVTRHDEAAFAALVERHGPLVWGLCRRLLANGHDAEDAFQAAFLALVRQAAAIRRRDRLGPWLYGVTLRIARKLRTTADRRRQTVDPPEAAQTDDPADATERRELQRLVTEELAALPAKYRDPLILCHLQGRTHVEAAAELGWPSGSVSRRMTKASELLRERLTRRGVALAVPALLAETVANAAPHELAAHTVRLAGLLAAAAPGVEAVPALALADAVLRPTAVGVKSVVAAGLMLTALGVGGVLGMGQIGTPTPQLPPPVAPKALGTTPAPAVRVDAEGVPLPPGVLARIGSSRMRHTNNVLSVAVAPDGRAVASLSYEGVRVWETSTGKQTRFVPFPDGSFVPDGLYGRANLVFAADGRDLLCLTAGPGQDAVAFLRLDPMTGRERLRVDLSGYRVTKEIGPFTVSGRCFAYRDQDDGSVRIGDSATGRELRRITVLGTVGGLAFSPDDRTLAIATTGETISFYDTSTGAKTGELRRENSRFTSLAYAPDGRTLASLNTDGQQLFEIHLWDLAAQRYRCQLPTNFTDHVHFRFSPDGKTIVTNISYDARADPVLWDAATGQEIRRFLGVSGVYCTAFSPDDQTLVAGTVRQASGTVVLWDVVTGRLRPASANPVVAVADLRYSDDGRRLIVRADVNGGNGFTVWDPATGQEVERSADVPAAQSITALSPDGRLLAGVDAGSVVRTWDAATGQEVRQMAGEQRIGPLVFPLVGRPVFTPDGRRLMAVDAERRLVVWDVATGQTLGTLPNVNETWPNDRRRMYLLVSPDGRRLAAGLELGGGIRVWDLATYKEVQRFPGPRAASVPWRGLAFSPDGRWLAVGDASGPLKLYDIETGRELRSWTAGRVGRVAFSPDGRMLATDDQSGTLRLWEVATGGERHPFTGHTRGIRAIAFAPDGRTLAAASNDAPIYVWDVLGLSEFAGRAPTAAELEQAWAALAGADAKVAFQAIRRLAAATGPAVTLLRERLKPTAAVDATQALRAVEALEYIATPGARQLLDELAKGADTSRVTVEARSALERLSRPVK